MNQNIMQSGKLKWSIIKDNEDIQVLINQKEFARFPIHIFPSEQEAFDTAKYNVINELIKELELTSFSIRNGICRPPDKKSNKTLFSLLGE